MTNDTTERSAVSPKISGDGARVFYKRTATAQPDVSDLILIETETLAARVLAGRINDLSLTEGRAVSNDGMRLVYSAVDRPERKSGVHL